MSYIISTNTSGPQYIVGDNGMWYGPYKNADMADEACRLIDAYLHAPVCHHPQEFPEDI